MKNILTRIFHREIWLWARRRSNCAVNRTYRTLIKQFEGQRSPQVNFDVLHTLLFSKRQIFPFNSLFINKMRHKYIFVCEKGGLTLLLLITALLFAGCGSSDDHGHSHGDGSEHSHEQPAQQTEEDHIHAHDEDDAHSHEDDSEHSHGDDEPHSHTEESEHTHETSELIGSGVITEWTDKTELFMEYPELIVGEEATFAVHLTRLSDFRPISESEVRFDFQSEDGNRISVTETEVQIPGIYGPDVVFEQAGKYDLTITIQGMVNDSITVDGIPVYNSAGDIPAHSEEEDPNLITFLKEQQWNIPFGTGKVTRRTLARTIEAHGEIQPVRSLEAVVSAPFSGIILSSMNQQLPVEGQEVSKGSSLLRLNPSIQSADGENYAQQFINAQSQFELARKNLERSERLYNQEAIPESELEQARMDFRQTRTRFQSINEIVQVDTSSIKSFGDSEESYHFELKSPIKGTIIETFVTPGTQVQPGKPLFRIVDMSRMWLIVHLPAHKRSSVETPGSAVFTVQGIDQLYELENVNGELISRGSKIDHQTRTLSLVYEIDNLDNSLQGGLFTTIEIDAEIKENVLAIPESALIEEEGNFVVYVHVAGESFEKRTVTTGIRNRGWVEVSSGLNGGEHVVTKNAYQVKLASLSSEAPSHGHAH